MKSRHAGLRGGARLLFGALLTLAFFGHTTAPALAGTADEITALPALDSLSRTETPLSNNGQWSPLAWAASPFGNQTGRVTTPGWGPSDAFSTINGAYWNPSTFSDANAGNAVAITMQIAPGSAGRYVALWLGMSSPSLSKTGYQLRWTVNSGSVYTVTLSRWSSGTETVLASNPSVSIPAGTTLAISDTGGTVTAWQGTGGSLTSFLSASDSVLSSGYAGIEGSGNISRSIGFKAGALPGAAPDADTEGVEAVNDNEAILKATIDPNGSDTTYTFEYGTTTAYGSVAPVANEEIGSGNEAVETQEAVAFLEPETTYHYRIVATNDAGTVIGEDKTLTTAARSVSPQQEAEERQEEENFTAKFTGGILPHSFINMMWSGHNPLTATPSHLEAIQRSGAKVLRVGVGPNMAGVMEWEVFDQIFDGAAKRGITILPIVAGGVRPQNEGEMNTWLTRITDMMDRYGPGGSFWAGKPYAKPPVDWEFGNEPNYAAEGPAVDPQAYGKFLEKQPMS